MLFVAEIGMNHEGNFDLAFELIRQAKFAGADVAKFQFGWRDKPGEINQIDVDLARKMSGWCDYFGIEFLASIISEEAFELASAVNFRRNKIASRTVIDKPELCEKIIAQGKETYVSLGMYKGEGWPFGPPTDKLHYIYCQSKYPTYPADIATMPERFSPDGFYGYSDHCHGVGACVVAMARGAQYIEKHFTLNKASQVIRDHTLSAEPEEMRTLTQLGGEVGRIVRAMNEGSEK